VWSGAIAIDARAAAAVRSVIAKDARDAAIQVAYVEPRSWIARHLSSRGAAGDVAIQLECDRIGSWIATR
jgi:hypothetical protein